MSRRVTTTSGVVEGVEDGAALRFLGIPYARPLVGELRFRPPRPPAPWPGVLVADRAGPAAPQDPATGLDALLGDAHESDEACLTLNVWTPGLAGRRPVLVWLHGGGFVSGSGTSVLYAADTIAAGGDVVVVTCNYRLGVLGWLAHPRLRDDATGAAGNWGLLDQVAVLSWVQANAAGFGGDPAQVTLWGESAGAISASALLAAPGARGLFQRVILQSGGPMTQPLEQAEAVTVELLAELGLPGSDVGAAIKDLRRVPVAELFAAQRALSPRRQLGEPLAFQPVIDGGALARSPWLAIEAGAAAGVDVLVGTNRDEMTLYTATVESPMTSDTELTNRLKRMFAAAGDNGAWPGPFKLVAAYRERARAAESPAGPGDLWAAILTDYTFGLSARRLADAHARAGGAVYMYRFDWESPALNGVLGACHGLELPFVWASIHRPAIQPLVGFGPDAATLAKAMQRAWAAFARYGDPSHSGLDRWPRWDPAVKTAMILGQHCREEPNLSDHLSIWPERW